MSAYGKIADALESDWASIARPEQMPPPGDWLIWLILAGRGWGKSFTGAQWARGIAEAGKVKHIALVGATAADVRDVMVEGPSGILSICPNSNRPLYEPSKRRVVWPNGVIATMFSSEEPERLRGPQHGASWCDELAAWRNLSETWDQLQFGLRIGKRPRVVITTTPKPQKLLKALTKRAAESSDVVITKGSTFDNAANLAESFLADIHRQFGGTRLGRQELDAEILDDTPGALWSRDLLDQTRRDPVNPMTMRRVVVAIDPAVSTSEGADETGIVVVGLGHDDHFYVLADLSGKYAPIEWARRAVGALKDNLGDRIIAESNQGGSMVEATIRQVDKNAPVRLVHASKGKVARAEPVSALWEQHRAHLCGTFPELEDQLCSYAAGGPSPDRLDAMVWGITALMSGGMAVLHWDGIPNSGTSPSRSSLATVPGSAAIPVRRPSPAWAERVTANPWERGNY
jgi:phage terminase large subunit-like protein